LCASSKLEFWIHKQFWYTAKRHGSAGALSVPSLLGVSYKSIKQYHTLGKISAAGKKLKGIELCCQMEGRLGADEV
jgi:hypothetical protein